MASRVAVAVVGVVLALEGCGAGGGVDDGGWDGGQDAGSCVPGQVATPRTAGPYLRLEARAFTSGAPVAGVVFAVDHRGTRVETLTDAEGNALVDAPDWDAGAVDVTALDPGGLVGPSLQSYLGIPRADAFRVRVLVPPPASGPVLTGSITGKQQGTDQVLLGSPGVQDYFQGTAATFRLDLRGLTVPAPLLGVEFTYAGTSPTDFTQTFIKWFQVSLPGPDGGASVDLQATAALPTATLWGTTLLPGGPDGPFAGAFSYAEVLGAPVNDLVREGAWLGATTTSALGQDGASVAWTLERVDAAVPAWLVPARTRIELGGSSPGVPFSMVVVDGVPAPGQTYTLPPLLAAAVPDGGVRLPTPLALGPAAPGAVRGLRLARTTGSLAGSWDLWVLDGRAGVSVPARPAAACGVEELRFVSAMLCTDSRLPLDCRARSRTGFHALAP